MSARQWLLHRGTEQFGPYTWEEVTDLARSGRVQPTDLVAKVGEPTSIEARAVPGLLPGVSAGPPPPVLAAAAPPVTPARRTRWLVPTLAVAAVALLIALVVVVVSGGDDSSSPRDTSSQDSGSSDTTDGATDSTVPAADLGIAETKAPAVEALVNGPTGALIAGDQVLVMLRDGAGRTEADAVAAAVGGEVVGQIEFVNLWQIEIPATDAAGVQRAIETATSVDGVELAFPNETAVADEEIWGKPVSALDDPVYNGPTGDGYRMIGVDKAWTYLRGSGLKDYPVKVGVLDVGLWKGNGEFDGDVKTEFTGKDAGPIADPESTNTTDAEGNVVTVPNPAGSHGTSVSSVIGANPNNGGTAGVAGVLGKNLTISFSDYGKPPYGGTPSTGQWGIDPVVAPKEGAATVTFPSGVIYTSGAMQAIVDQLSAKPPARVINMSWGRRNDSGASAQAYQKFFEKMAREHPDTLFVASAGNNGYAPNGSTSWPGGRALPNMITVGNVMNDTTNNAWTNKANSTSGQEYEVTLAAPGEQAVRGVDADGKVIDTFGGTSMATPQVTAAAALLLSIKPELTAQEIKDLLSSTARTTIKQADGTEKAIDAGVGGKVLAVDLAVLKLIAQERAARGLEPAELTAEYLENLGKIDAVAVSGEPNEWTVRGIVKACDPGCTDVTITLSGEGAVSGDTTQHLEPAGEVSWSVTLPKYPATITVKRSDNGAASVIQIDPVDLNGRWTGTATIADVKVPEGADTQGCDFSELLGGVLGLDLEITTDPDGGGVVVITLSPPASSDSGPQTFNAELQWNGPSVTMTVTAAEGTFQFTGTAARLEGGTGAQITGTWSAADPKTGIVATGPWQVTKAA